MTEFTYRLLVKIAFLLALIVIGWSIYDGALQEKLPGENDYHAGNKYFEDGEYQQALLSYQTALTVNPGFIHARRGVARSLMQLNEYENSLMTFNAVINLEPTFPASYVNRGILLDRMGRYTEAIKNYQKAIELDAEIAEGPSWMTRFLRNQAEKPPNIHDRMNYLRDELQKPESEQVLSVPVLDGEQAPYKS